MCLMRILPPPVAPTGFGFVARKMFSGSYRSIFYNYETPQTLGVEQKAELFGDLISQEDAKRYPCGFHIFESMDDAFDYALTNSNEAVLHVSYRGAHTRGLQGARKVVVAEFITLIQEIKRDVS